MKDKFIKKYLRMAKQIGEDKNPCYSRQIGTVIVDPITNNVMGVGYNGPPRETPHCDSEQYLKQCFWPQLSPADRASISELTDMIEARIKFPSVSDAYWEYLGSIFAKKHKDCKICPRRLVNAKSGEKTELCSCVHSELNAILNCNKSVYGCEMFSWCGEPCFDCAKAIIQAGIIHVHCVNLSSVSSSPAVKYSKSAGWLLNKAKIEVSIYKAEDVLV